MDRSRVGYLWIIVMFFIRCLDSHSDGTHSLQRIQCWASDVMQNLSKYIPFWGNYSFQQQLWIVTGNILKAVNKDIWLLLFLSLEQITSTCEFFFFFGGGGGGISGYTIQIHAYKL